MVDRRTFLATTGAFAAGLAGCLGRGAGDADHDIGMSSSAFLPAEYRVEPGTTVTWKNTSTHAHTVTAYENTLPDGTEYFASGGYETEQGARDAWYESGGGAIYAGKTFSHTFEQPGRYSYVCIPHESSNMAGVILVGDVEETDD
ncbi:plastocyanin/azurin family copper-binding protein [Halorhabdus sp. BNX81]|uniref:plastocyanin/azurin family copper-binding protein n=1 Tax=Halorhabdus sp. BNX81 TaxID=2980181 RepID=UPI0023DD38E2|nr:plastocyanin/azurin family copper-binding protein [Halorhabdus sp. BNX81]WEL20932.1 Halocyanin [Halorhabdus sp. BNX81]